MPRRTARSDRELTSVLFTDVVGSTELAAELGDAGWKKLLASHHAVMRRLLKRHSGREVDTAGDGFFITFDQPAHAIACALDMIDTLAGLGIHIRAGVHFGEVDIVDGKAAGMTVHIGARIMAQGRADELIVSSTVRDLMTGSDLPFVDRGFQQLKGVDSQWHLYEVAGRVREREVVGFDPGEPQASPWRHPVVLGAIAVVVVAVAVTAAALAGGGSEEVSPEVDTLVRLDGARPAAVVPVGSTPWAIVARDSVLWVANKGVLTVQRVDTESGTADPAEGGLQDAPTSIAVGDGFVWIGSSLSEGSLVQVDPDQQNFRRDVELGGPVSGMTTAPGVLWASDEFGDVIRRLDVATGEVTELAPLGTGSGPTGLAVNDGSLWVALHGAHEVLRLDGTTGEVLETVPVDAGAPDQVAIGGGYVWVSFGGGDAIVRIDPGTGSAFTIPDVCDAPAGIAADDSGVWVACSQDGRVLKLDPATGATTETADLGADLGPWAVSITPEGVWVSLIGR